METRMETRSFSAFRWRSMLWQETSYYFFLFACVYVRAHIGKVSSRRIYGRCSLTAMKRGACSHPAHRPYIIREAGTASFLLSRTVERHSRGLSHLAPPRTRLARETRKFHQRSCITYGTYFRLKCFSLNRIACRYRERDYNTISIDK